MEGLTALPTEILLHVLSFLDLPSLLSFRRTCKDHNDIVQIHSEQVYQNILANLGFCSPRTAADSGLSGSILRSDGQQLDESHGRELGKAIVNQRSATSYFDGVDTFEELARRRVSLDRNWLDNQFRINDIPASNVWRIKVDTERGLLLTSATDGAIRALDLRTEEVIWELPNRVALYPHIEYTGGYLIHNLQDNNFYVWRHRSIHVANPPAVDPATFPTPSSTEFVPHARLQQPKRVFCFKARYPYLVGGSPHGNEAVIFVWDFVKNELVKTIAAYPGDLSDSFYEMHYIDLDRDYIFVATEACVEIFRMRDGVLVSTIPPDAINVEDRHTEEIDNGDGHEGEAPRNLRMTFVAVHHSGSHLLALSEVGQLYWTCRYPQAISGAAPISEDDWVVLNLGQVDAGQLSVENGRAVFTVDVTYKFRGSLVEDIFVLSLPEWQSVERFKTIAPKLHAIHISAISTDQRGISRIEMDSTSIYVTVRSAIPIDLYDRIMLINTGGRAESWEGLWAGFKDKFKWKSLGGEVLGDAWPDTIPTRIEQLRKGGLGDVLGNMTGHRDRVFVYNYF